MSERNKLIHELLERGCWHPFVAKSYVPHCKKCGLPLISHEIENPNYINDEHLPHSTVVEIVTKAVERWPLEFALKLWADHEWPLTRHGIIEVILKMPAPVIVGAVADLCEEEQTNDK